VWWNVEERTGCRDATANGRNIANLYGRISQGIGQTRQPGCIFYLINCLQVREGYRRTDLQSGDIGGHRMKPCLADIHECFNVAQQAACFEATKEGSAGKHQCFGVLAKKGKHIFHVSWRMEVFQFMQCHDGSQSKNGNNNNSGDGLSPKIRLPVNQV
jgi:hypothetical protein